ncbi:MAG: nitroreductase family protein [Pseudomonadota bacterium]
MTPLAPRPEVLDFLLTRRSRPAKTLSQEGPSREEILTILTAAARSPDHGKLVPWRFAIAEAPAMARLADLAARHAGDLGIDPAKAEKSATAFSQGGALITVIGAPVASEKIPDWEQALSAGAACLAALNAALALGWGANWLTGPFATHAPFLAAAFGCAKREYAAGFIHIGRETVVPADRDRPDLTAITTWLD